MQKTIQYKNVPDSHLCLQHLRGSQHPILRAQEVLISAGDPQKERKNAGDCSANSRVPLLTQPRLGQRGAALLERLGVGLAAGQHRLRGIIDRAPGAQNPTDPHGWIERRPDSPGEIKV